MLAYPPSVYSSVYNPANFVSNVETQIATKQDVIDTNNRLNASFVGTGLINNTEFNFLNGVTGPIQSQINWLDGVLVSLMTNYNNIDNTSVTTTLLTTNRIRGLVKSPSSNTTYAFSGLPCYINVVNSINLTLPNPGNDGSYEGYTVDIINSLRFAVTITVSAGTGSQEIERDGSSSNTFVLNRRARKMVILASTWCVLGYDDH